MENNLVTRTIRGHADRLARLEQNSFKAPDISGAEFGLELARGIKDYFRRVIAPLEKRITELESRPQVKYQGVYRDGAEYSEGALVTRDGSIFHANRTTRAAPGDGSMDWQLAVKR